MPALPKPSESRYNKLYRGMSALNAIERQRAGTDATIKNLYDEEKMNFSYKRDGSFLVTPEKLNTRKEINRAHSKVIGRDT
jgi:hypothetical protein